MMDKPEDQRDLDAVHDFVSSAEVERELLERFPGLPRLIDAIGRRKRLLRALATWREPRSQKLVAERIGSTQPAIARLELGKVDPRLSTLERYAAALNANFIWQVVDDDGNPVSDEFKWSTDVTYRSSRPSLGQESAASAAIAGDEGLSATSEAELATVDAERVKAPQSVAFGPSWWPDFDELPPRARRHPVSGIQEGRKKKPTSSTKEISRLANEPFSIPLQEVDVKFGGVVLRGGLDQFTEELYERTVLAGASILDIQSPIRLQEFATTIRGVSLRKSTRRFALEPDELVVTAGASGSSIQRNEAPD